MSRRVDIAVDVHRKPPSPQVLPPCDEAENDHAGSNPRALADMVYSLQMLHPELLQLPILGRYLTTALSHFSLLKRSENAYEFRL